MQLFTGHNNRCLVWSAAMVLNEDPEALLDELGSDGLEVVNPQLRKPACYRGHHKQEIMDLFFLRNLALLNVELYPNFNPRRNLIDSAKACEQRFRDYIEHHDAILIGRTQTNHPHAVAWSKDEQRVYDPNGRIGPIAPFQVREALVAVPIIGK